MREDSAPKGAKGKLRSGKLLEIVTVLILAVVVAALLLSYFTGKEEGAASETTYVSALEARLEHVLSQIGGAGGVDVLITVRSEGEKVIATESTVNEDGSVTTAPVFSGGDVVVLEEMNPEITGVLIVAAGAQNLSVRFALAEAAASVLNIDQSLIKVYAKETDD